VRRTFVAAAGVIVALLARGASAEEGQRSVRMTLFAQSGAVGYLSRVQTAAGIGGGLGARATFDERWLAQVDANLLALIGDVSSARVGVGLQRSGTWRPAALLTLSAFFGERLRFLTDEHPEPVTLPGLALGAHIAPLRFRAASAEVSAFEIGIGAGWDFPGAGLALNLTLLQVGIDL
jgi:hypothetical protein